jgi:hypothetical protein
MNFFSFILLVASAAHIASALSMVPPKPTAGRGWKKIVRKAVRAVFGRRNIPAGVVVSHALYFKIAKPIREYRIQKWTTKWNLTTLKEYKKRVMRATRVAAKKVRLTSPKKLNRYISLRLRLIMKKAKKLKRFRWNRKLYRRLVKRTMRKVRKSEAKFDFEAVSQAVRRVLAMEFSLFRRVLRSKRIQKYAKKVKTLNDYHKLRQRATLERVKNMEVNNLKDLQRLANLLVRLNLNRRVAPKRGRKRIANILIQRVENSGAEKTFNKTQYKNVLRRAAVTELFLFRRFGNLYHAKGNAGRSFARRYALTHGGGKRQRKN